MRSPIRMPTQQNSSPHDTPPEAPPQSTPPYGTPQAYEAPGPYGTPEAYGTPGPYGTPTAPHNPYEELAALADPEDGPRARDPLGLGLREDPEDEPGAGWEPPDHRHGGRARRRFAALPMAMKAVVAVAVGAAFLTVADRWAVLYAEKRTAEKMKDSLQLAAEPEVTIHGFPFVTQLADKRLDKVDVAIPDVAADRVSLARVAASAENIRLNGSLPTAIRGATIGRVQGNVLLSFDDLNRELGSSQVRFSPRGRESVLAEGTLPIAGHDLRVRAEAHIKRVGGRGIETDITGMRLDIADMATYRPGKGPDAGLRLTPQAAERVREDLAKAKALLSVPALAERVGVPKPALAQTLRSEKRLHEVTGAPRFAREAMKLNLVDVVADHPELLKRIGIDPSLVTGLTELTQPELADRLSLSFQLPDTPGYIRLQNITVEREGIRADLSGMDLPFGGK